MQLLREGIGVIHAVAYTHEHADHLFGLDDLRIFPLYTGEPVPLYCEQRVEERIRLAYDYAFADRDPTHGGWAPRLCFHRLTLEPFEVLGTQITPIRFQHGPYFEVLGYRVGHIAYCTDAKEIPPESWPLLEGLDVLILNGLRGRPHATHFSLYEAIEVARKVQPKRTVFTHLSHDLDYESTNARLPEGMELAFDGMQIPLS